MSIDLMKTLKAKHADFERLLESRPSTHYKVYKIPKRTVGYRVIAQPTARIKDIQRTIVNELMSCASIHDVATAYVKEKNIINNAGIHSKSNYLLKLDLENFFNCITPKILFKELKNQNITLSDSDKLILEQFCFWNRSKRKNGSLVLSVGASSSPFISNVIMKSFDMKLFEVCSFLNVNYSRYADDLTFSTDLKNILKDIHSDVKKNLYRFFGNRIRINNSKVVYSSKGHNRHVTGITLTNDNKLSLGRERKRYISSLVFKFKQGKLDLDDIQHLKGLISFANHIESDFIIRLMSKYGCSIIHEINKYKVEGE